MTVSHQDRRLCYQMDETDPKVPGLSGGLSSTWSPGEDELPDLSLLLLFSHHVFKVCVQLHG